MKMAFSNSSRRAVVNDEPVLDTGDIQADVTLGVNMKQYLIVVYLDVTDPDLAKEWLRDVILPKITTTDAMRAFRERFREARKLLSSQGDTSPKTPKPVLPGSSTVNVSFSYEGLVRLGAPDVEKFAGPDGFGTAFSLGLERRAGILGDVAAGCPPETWVTGPRTPHILLQLGTDSESEFDKLRLEYCPCDDAQEFLKSKSQRGVKVVHADVAHRLNSLGSEQFGFHDAVSNPALRGYFSDASTPLYQRTHPLDRDHALPGQDLIYPGEFIMLRDQDTDSVWTEGLAGDGGARMPSEETWASKYASSAPDWAANGAFLVNRRLRQDVAGFWAWCNAEAAKSSSSKSDSSESESKCPYHKSMQQEDPGFTAEEMAAKMFGRWPSGCPLMRSPLGDVPALGADAKANNAYAFACPRQIRTALTDTWPRAVTEDVDGTICPLAAHSRKMNPRDGVNDASTPFRRRIVRRGLPYGPAMDAPRSGVDDGKDRGLQFVAYCSSIEEQFEFLQRKWANSDHSPTDPTYVDPVIGQVAPGASKPFSFVDIHGNTRTVDAVGAGTRNNASQFVSATGGGYFFSPSMTALAMLSSSSSSSSKSPPPDSNDASPPKTAPFVYDFPGSLTDLPASAQQAWSDTIQGLFDSMVDRLPAGAPYFSLADDPNARFLADNRITWDGFAHKFVARYASDREIFEAADTLEPGDDYKAETTTVQPNATVHVDAARRERCGEVSRVSLKTVRTESRQQDEYCEWHVARDATTGKVIRVDVTTEFPEYWAYMYSVDPATVLSLYRQYISPDVQEEDLLDNKGQYDKYNKWNTELGCMHLQQPEDTAGAAVGICGSSTTQLVDSYGRRYAGKQALMEAHGSGEGSSSPLRGSDPSITQDIYELTAPGRGAKLTLADPIGVYMDLVDVSGWAAPDGSPLVRDDVVKLVRGQPGRALRYSISIPEDCGYVLGDCTVGGQKVDFGGQVVKNAITCYLGVQTYAADAAPPVFVKCIDDARRAVVPAEAVALVAEQHPPPYHTDDDDNESRKLLGEQEENDETTSTAAWAARRLCGCCDKPRNHDDA